MHKEASRINEWCQVCHGAIKITSNGDPNAQYCSMEYYRELSNGLNKFSSNDQPIIDEDDEDFEQSEDEDIEQSGDEDVKESEDEDTEQSEDEDVDQSDHDSMVERDSKDNVQVSYKIITQTKNEINI